MSNLSDTSDNVKFMIDEHKNLFVTCSNRMTEWTIENEEIFEGSLKMFNWNKSYNTICKYCGDGEYLNAGVMTEYRGLSES